MAAGYWPRYALLSTVLRSAVNAIWIAGRVLCKLCRWAEVPNGSLTNRHKITRATLRTGHWVPRVTASGRR